MSDTVIIEIDAALYHEFHEETGISTKTIGDVVNASIRCTLELLRSAKTASGGLERFAADLAQIVEECCE